MEAWYASRAEEALASKEPVEGVLQLTEAEVTLALAQPLPKNYRDGLAARLTDLVPCLKASSAAVAGPEATCGD